MLTKTQRDVQAKRDRYAANPELKERDRLKRLERMRVRYQTDPEYRKKKLAYETARKRVTKYGITDEEVAQMLAAQGGICSGCLMPIAGSQVCVDHNHTTGAVRGLLCRLCNLALHKKVTPETLRRLADYLEGK